MAFAVVVQEGGDRRGIDGEQRRALGVMIIVGRGVARLRPDRIDRPPAESRACSGILRHRQDGQRAAQRLAIRGGGVQPGLDQRGDALADLQRGGLFDRHRRDHRPVDMREPGVDHRDRPVLEGEAGDVAVDAGRIRRHVARIVAPAIEGGVGRDPVRQQRAHLVESQVLNIGHGSLGHMRLSSSMSAGLATVLPDPRRTSTSATATIATPIRSGRASVSP